MNSSWAEFSVLYFLLFAGERVRERERVESSLKSLEAEVSECSGAGWSRVSPRIITDNPLSPTNTKDKY